MTRGSNILRRLRLWYINLSRRSKVALVSCAIAVALVSIVVIGYLLLMPQKVSVRYGTIVMDPVDGHVWEDNTRTAMVDPDEADKYRIEYIEKLSPEHEQQRAQEEAQAAQEAQALESEGLEAVEVVITDQQKQDMETLQDNVDTMSSNVISGMEILNDITVMKSKLINSRNQVSGIAVDPALEPLKQQIIRVFDLYIQAADLYIQAIATADVTYVEQGNAKVEEANAVIQSIVPSTQQMDALIEEFNSLVDSITG